jgi:hypothetical protein
MSAQPAARRKVQHHSEKKALEARQKMAPIRAQDTATTRARDLRNAHMQAEMDALSNDP